MRDFESFLEEGKVKEKSGSPAEARSLRVQALKRFEQQVESPELTNDKATFMFEDAYEALRQYLQSFMAEEGYKPYSHEAIIAYSVENGFLSKAQANSVNQFRKLRNDIRYRGETSSIEKAESMIELAKSILKA
jgi:hypothetical protein